MRIAAQPSRAALSEDAATVNVPRSACLAGPAAPIGMK